MSRNLSGAVTLAIVLLLVAPLPGNAQELSDIEGRIAQSAAGYLDEALDLLERTTNINSGSLNPEGVKQVSDVMEPELATLGFDTRYELLPSEMKRGGHLIAERSGSSGRSVLMIGHLDTVFERDSPFQRFERDGDTIKGPGVIDTKGGNVVMLYALKALADAGALNGTIRVIFTGDEERPGLPLSVARHELIELGKKSDVALGFESGSRDAQGELAVVARRGATTWSLEVGGVRAHSSGVFGEGVGAGAIYETARILDSFYGELRGERYLTFNVGVILGGSDVDYNPQTSTGTAGGKTNAVAQKLVLEGDIRTMSNEQLERAQERMRAIVAIHLPQTTASIRFAEGYPAMSPNDANYELLSVYSEISEALGIGPVRPFDPARRGAADISFVAPHVGAALGGLGPIGGGGHTVEETLEVSSIVPAIQRAALLVYRLTR